MTDRTVLGGEKIIPRKDMLRSKLGGSTFEQVDLIFREIRMPKDRGGTIRNAAAKLEAQPDRSHHESYHVEMTWTEEQAEYIELTMGYLEDYARGRLQPGDVQPRPLSIRIENKMRENVKNGTSMQFGQVIREELVSVYEDFSNKYPQWTPALSAIFTIAGAEGSLLAINKSIFFLSNALQGKLNDLNVHTFENEQIARVEFVAEHPAIFRTPELYEVWCSGETFAKIIVDSARVAAVSLAKSKEEFSEYDVLNEKYTQLVEMKKVGKWISQLTSKTRVRQKN